MRLTIDHSCTASEQRQQTKLRETRNTGRRWAGGAQNLLDGIVLVLDTRGFDHSVRPSDPLQ